MVDLNKPLFQCTLGEFAEAVALKMRVNSAPEPIRRDMVKGVPGVANLFKCGLSQARTILRSGAIDEAVTRIGARSIIVDSQKALQLAKQNNLIK